MGGGGGGGCLSGVEGGLRASFWKNLSAKTQGLVDIMTIRFTAFLALALLCSSSLSHACSTLAAGDVLPQPNRHYFSRFQLLFTEHSGRMATADGSVIISQTTDGDGNDDARIVRVPAADWPSNSRRKIIPDYSVGYPRYVGTDRGAPLCRPFSMLPSVIILLLLNSFPVTSPPALTPSPTQLATYLKSPAPHDAAF
jgi:hypothetical protein